MRRDPHSYADDEQPRVRALVWAANFDFGTHTLHGTATLELAAPAAAGPLDLDTRDLVISSVDAGAAGEGGALAWTLAPAEPILGARLRIELPAGTTALRIAYRTAPEASALQWLTPAQTAGGVQPFLFSQCQAIHARSIVPLPDTPSARLTYQATLEVPAALRALMAARHDERQVEGGRARERWTMPQPIPPYLLAFAIGDLESRDVGPRSRVWAEPALLEAAAAELGGVDAMLTTAEALFGPYDWERFDILTMPPSFPYGGMENPRLTFLTPSLLAGDRSLVSVLAHELAHSWTGNLVSAASAEHFWLNEGFTVFAERRIVAALWGDETAALQAALGWRALDEALQRFAERPELTRLRTHLTGIDPDEVFSEVPYEKGYLFLRALEEAAGPVAFERFLRAWVSELRFGAADDQDFRRLCDRELPGAWAAVDGEAWLHQAGLPPSAPRPRSRKLVALEALGAAEPPPALAASWSATEWTLYLDALPRPAAPALLDALERDFALTASRNHEVLVAWLLVALQSGHAAVLPRVEELLASVGRMKYLKPLYGALAAAPATRPLAVELFARHRDAYHPIAQQVIGGLLGRA